MRVSGVLVVMLVHQAHEGKFLSAVDFRLPAGGARVPPCVGLHPVLERAAVQAEALAIVGHFHNLFHAGHPLGGPLLGHVLLHANPLQLEHHFAVAMPVYRPD